MNKLSKLLQIVASPLKRLSSGFAETPKLKADDFELEHFLLYHSLVGSTPENQKQFRDVRIDIIEAIKSGSKAQLAIALKLSPLWWSDKLAAIISELTENTDFNIDKKQVVNLLIPDNEIAASEKNSAPITSDDWRARSNSALLLAHMGASEAVSYLISQLSTSEDAGNLAFCHISYALGILQTNEAKQALIPFLSSEEPWLRVDAARALALWATDTVFGDLTEAIFTPARLSYYLSINIARRHKLIQLLSSNEYLWRQAAFDMIIQIVEASEQTFASDIVQELAIDQALPLLLTNPEQTSAREVRAALALANWQRKQSSNNSKVIDAIIEITAGKTITEKLIQQLSAAPTSTEQTGQLRHAIYLAGTLKLDEATPLIEKQLNTNSPVLNDAVTAIANLGREELSGKIIDLANELIDIEKRTNQPLHVQPVFEENSEKVYSYFAILQALGKLPSEESINFLLKSTADFAPDKRHQALASLLSATSHGNLKEARVAKKVEECLNDPSPMVKVIALEGVDQLQLINLLPSVLQLTSASEGSVKRQSFATLSSLCQKGHKQAVHEATQQKLSHEIDPYRREDLKRLMKSAR